MADDSQGSFDFTDWLPEAARDAIRDGMGRADEHADVDWKIVFDRCVAEAARKSPQITSDDVLAEWEAIPHRPVTHNLSAIGPAMKRAAKDGILTSTNRVVRSQRSIKHGIRHTIWQSNIYRIAS